MRVDLRKEGEGRKGGSVILTPAQQKKVDEAKKKKQTSITIDPDEGSKSKHKPVPVEKDKTEDDTEE